MEEVNYKDVINLGFVRIEMDDNQFYNQYGYEWFLVEFPLAKNKRKKKETKARWDSTNRLIEIIKLKDNTIVSKMFVTLEQMETIIDYVLMRKIEDIDETQLVC